MLCIDMNRFPCRCVSVRKRGECLRGYHEHYADLRFSIRAHTFQHTIHFTLLCLRWCRSYFFFFFFFFFLCFFSNGVAATAIYSSTRFGSTKNTNTNTRYNLKACYIVEACKKNQDGHSRMISCH